MYHTQVSLIRKSCIAHKGEEKFTNLCKLMTLKLANRGTSYFHTVFIVGWML